MLISLRGIAWTAFAIAVVLLVGSSILLFRATQRFAESNLLVANSHEVETVLEDLSSQVFEATNSRRAFAITGDESMLGEYRSAAANIPRDLARLRQLMPGGSQAHRQELNLLASDIQSELDLLNSSLSAGLRGTSSSEREIDLTRQTAGIGRRVQNLLEKIREDEDRLLEARRSVARSNYQHTLRLIAASFIIALMLLAAEMFLLSFEFTQHQRSERTARQSQELVNAFFSSSTVGFGILDSQFRYIRVNDVLPRMAGRKPEDLLGKSVSEIFTEQDISAETLLQEVLRTGKPIPDREVTAGLHDRPDDVRHWLVNYFPVCEAAGDFTQVGIIAVDVTARRNAEEALRKLSGRLLGIQDQERRRIARELHDSLGQYLAGLKIAIQMLSVRLDANDPLIRECMEILDKSIAETRTLSHLLHPPLLDEAGFASAASWFVTGFSQRSGIPVSLDMPPDLPRLPEAVEIALFRVLQESLTNVHRHSHADSAEISVEADAEQVTVEVRDHGCGIPLHILAHIEGEGSQLGVGLAGMRERVHELGGVLEVTSNDHGTSIRATVPLAVRDQQSSPLRLGAEHTASRQASSRYRNPPTL
jgi:PAS domain S-box-containing protein